MFLSLAKNTNKNTKNTEHIQKKHRTTQKNTKTTSNTQQNIEKHDDTNIQFNGKTINKDKEIMRTTHKTEKTKQQNKGQNIKQHQKHFVS